MANATIPKSWDVEVLSTTGNNWETIASLTNEDIGPDGHVQLCLGWTLDDGYRIKGEMPDSVMPFLFRGR